MTTADAKKSLRNTLRQRRRNLTAQEQEKARQAIVTRLLGDSPFATPHRVALYIAQDGELDLSGLVEHCWRSAIEVYLPVLYPDRPDLGFARYRADSQLVPNRFGILEPLNEQIIHPSDLGWVLLPLVGFDHRGGRLGMGGGFYDRTFAESTTWPQRPRLIGIAHECQKIEAIPRERWDVNLQAIVSPRQWYLPTE